ncbi:MAG: TetR/AcrR family transcriptional regulator [Actinomycetota bacterium]
MDTTTRRDQIVDAAMRRFAEVGFRAARVEDVAKEVGVAKGTVFLHFRNKEGLFLAAYERAVDLLPRWLDAPDDVRQEGFWAVLRYWLDRAEDLAQGEFRVANRVAMMGRHDSSLDLRRPIQRFMRSEDPYGTLEFVEWGIGRGELRSDVDVEMTTSMLEWAGDSFQDVLSDADFDPGLVRKRPHDPDRKAARIGEFIEILRGGIGSS